MKCYLLDLPDNDCWCVGIHKSIPHWLYMDRMMFDKNLRLIESRVHGLVFKAYTQQESIRLDEKLRNIKRLCTREDAIIVLPGGYREGDYEIQESRLLRDVWDVLTIEDAVTRYCTPLLKEKIVQPIMQLRF
jgi:hypothetical protein